MSLIWHYKSTKKGKKIKKYNCKTTKKYGRKLLSEDEAFCIKDCICSHLLLSKSRSSVLLCSGAYRTVMLLPESGSLELFSVLGGNTAQQKAEGDQGPDQASCTQQSKALSHPRLGSISHQRLQKPLEQNTAVRNTMVCHYCKGLSHIFPKPMRGYLSLSALCSRPCW